MKLLILLSVSFFLVSDCIGQISLTRSYFLKIDSILIGRLQSGLKITTDSVNRLRGQVKIITATITKQEAILAKKDTVWLTGFGGYGTRLAPFNQNAVKAEIAVLKKSIVDLKSALSAIRNDIYLLRVDMGVVKKYMSNVQIALAALRETNSSLTSKINVQERDITNLKAALILIRQDIADLKASQ